MLLRSVKLWLSVIFCIGVVAFFWPRLPKENVLNIMFPIAEHWKNMREFPQLWRNFKSFFLVQKKMKMLFYFFNVYFLFVFQTYFPKFKIKKCLFFQKICSLKKKEKYNFWNFENFDCFYFSKKIEFLFFLVLFFF